MLSLLLAVLVQVQPAVAARGSAARVQDPGATPELRIRVDPRVELLSAVFRLAGYREYGQGRVGSYASAVDEYFGPVLDHPVFRHAQRLRAERGIAFDACMLLAVHLTDDGELRPLSPLERPGVELIEDGRWTAEAADAFLADLRDFAALTEFDAFFAEQRALFSLTEHRLRAVIDEHADLTWFERFFGVKPSVPFTLVPAVLNGPANYGVRYIDPAGQEHLYAILGVEVTDAEGLPVFPPAVLSTVVHEFGHSFVNHLVYAHAGALRASGERLFAQVRPQMQRQAYGTWTTMLCESLVRAGEVRYALDRGDAEGAARRVEAEIERGFLWMEGLAALLGDYEAERAEFPTLRDFMPRVVAFFDETAERRGAAGE